MSNSRERRDDCEAVRERDGSTYCPRCAFRWDPDTDNPPACADEPVKAERVIMPKYLDAPLNTQGVVMPARRPAFDQEKQDATNRRGLAALKKAAGYD